MRGLWLAICLWLCACSLVVSGRTKDYEGACADEEEAASARYGAQEQSVLIIAFGCGGCPEQDCIEDCVSMATESHVSKECSACYADAVECAGTQCDNDCKDADANCIDCLCDAGCAEALDACAGLAVATCPGR